MQVMPPYLDSERGVLPDRLVGPSPRHAALARMNPQPGLGPSPFPKIEPTLSSDLPSGIVCSGCSVHFLHQRSAGKRRS